jgi:hypothetical protein
MTVRRTERFSLIGLLAFGALSTIAGGIALITGDISLPAEWLDGTPFDSYTVPALILALVVGSTQLAALVATLRHRPWATPAAGVAGAVLMGWIIGGVLIVGTRDSGMRTFQLIYFVTGLVEFGLAGLKVRVRRHGF